MSVLKFPNAKSPSERDNWYGYKYKAIGKIPDLEAIVHDVIVQHMDIDMLLEEHGDEGSRYAIWRRPLLKEINSLVRVYDVFSPHDENLGGNVATVYIRPDFEHIAARINAIINTDIFTQNDTPDNLKGIVIVFDRRINPSPKFKDVYSMRVSGNLNA